ncbi:hypothetical protein [Brevundimonas diminuta]|jgi:hypothetical protein|nr:hypothetical protein [Brevundimonas diminuta]MDM8352183.1 hypothetical protein [Brevundimonas diminuta]
MSTTPKQARERWVYTRFITRNGKRIYHPTGGLYRFKVKDR